VRREKTGFRELQRRKKEARAANRRAAKK